MRRAIVPALLAIAMVASSSVNASAFGLFDKLCNPGCCDSCDVACEPACGCEAPCEPVCGCEVVEPCCDTGCHSGPKFGGLFGCLFKKHHNNCCEPACGYEPACGCEAPCAPACGCEAPCEPACGCEAPCEPACGCEVAQPCCDSGCCSKPRFGCFLDRLFHKHDRCCDTGCEPACGCEAPCEPTCGCEPSCGWGH